nr:8301_t:CDS:2 [Entrophospora candida]
MLIPSSSAASECNLSAFSYIHDKKHNHLTSEQVFKLVYIYSNYKLQQPQKCYSIDIHEDENEDNELSEVEGNLNDEIREGDVESDNRSNESDTTIELYELDGYEND